MQRRVILRRRALAIAAALAATALIWLLLIRDGSQDGSSELVLTAAKVSSETRNLLATLSPGEKASQLVLGAIAPAAGAAPGIGGVLIGRSAWPGANDAPKLIAGLHDAGGPVPPLIAAHQEGGSYRQLADLPPEEREIAIGDLGDTDLAERWGEETSAALAAAGFDLNLAPVADVATLDSPIADRAFSDDTAVVTAMTTAALRGCRRGGVACAPGHFPGLGASSGDTDSDPATVSLDGATLAGRDLVPFETAIDRGVPAIVVSHAFYAAYDPVTPASQSPPILDGLLRGELGFEGAAITDDLEAGAIRARSRVDEAAVAAVAAGADMVQISDPAAVPAAVQALTAAAGAGTISGQRLDDAAGRVLELKRKLGLFGGGANGRAAR